MSEAILGEKKFSKKQAIKFGWQRTTNNLGFLIVFFIIIYSVQFFFDFFADLFVERLLFLSMIFHLGSLIVTVFCAIFSIKIGLRLYDNDKIGSYDFLAFNASTFFKFLLAYLLYLIMLSIGFILLVVPGIYLAIKYQYAQYLIIDKDMDVIEAFKESGRITQGHKWNLLAFALLLLAVFVIGVLVFIVGILVAIPVMVIAAAYVYKKLSSNISMEEAHTPPPIPTQNKSVQSDSAFQAPT